MPNKHINDWNTDEMALSELLYPVIGCNNCGFMGLEHHLIFTYDDGEAIKACPVCKTDWYLIIIPAERKV